MHLNLLFAIVLMSIFGLPSVINNLDIVNFTLTSTDGTPPGCTMYVDEGAYTLSSSSERHLKEEIIIVGNRSRGCIVSVKLYRGQSVTLELLQGNVMGLDYLFVVERENKIVAFKDIQSHCEYNLVRDDPQGEVNIHLRADVTLRLKNAITDDGEIIPKPAHCTVSTFGDDGSRRCCKTTEYPDKVDCVHSISEVIHDYRIYKFKEVLFDTRCEISSLYTPKECNNTIMGNYEIIYRCSNDGDKPTRALLTFPTNITHLNLSHNHLVSLTSDAFDYDVGSLVKRLDLSNNALTTVDTKTFRNLPNLEELDLSDNNGAILTLDVFGSLRRLRKLTLNGNKLATLSGICLRLPKLETLYVVDNEMVQIQPRSFKHCARLTGLDLSDNKLQTLFQESFLGLTSLLYMFIYNNELTDIQRGAFEGLEQLINLDLGGNNLTALSPAAFKGAHRRLRTLALWRNEIASLTPGVFQHLSRVYTLNLKDNQLETLENGTFSGLDSLRILYLSGNRLARVYPGVFDGLTDLEQLYLEENRLEELAVDFFHGLTKLRHVNLNNNMIRVVENGAFRNLQRLEYLSLDGNRLRVLPNDMFDGLRHLMYLRLRSNRLTKIETKVFDQMRHLRTLDLSDNTLSALPMDIFNGLIHAVALNLSRNRLQDLPSVANMSRLTSLALTGNDLAGLNKDTLRHLSSGTMVTVDQPQVCVCYHVANCTATYPKSAYFTCDRLLSKQILSVFLWIFGCSSLVGNALVLSWGRFRQHKKEISVQFLLICNLAVSDLLMGIYMIIVASADMHYVDSFPMHSEAWRTGIICKVAGALAICSSEASVLFVTLISVDRFHGMRYPYSAHRLRGRSTKTCVVCIWLFASILGAVPSILAGVNTNFYDTSHVCIGLPLVRKVITENQEILVDDSIRNVSFGSNARNITITTGQNAGMHFSTVIFCGFNLLCLLIILCSYIDIVKQVYRSRKESGRRRVEIKHEISLNLKVAAIVSTDFFCWFPIIIGGILVQTGVLSLSPAVCAWAITFVLPINSAINPYLYTISYVVADYLKRRRNRKLLSGGTEEQHGHIPLMRRETNKVAI